MNKYLVRVLVVLLHARFSVVGPIVIWHIFSVKKISYGLKITKIKILNSE